LEALQTNFQETKEPVLYNQSSQKHLFTSPLKFKYGFEVPKDYVHGIRLDNKNNNTKWQDVTKLEMKRLDDYQIFNDLGVQAEVPERFKKTRVHLILDVKHDGRHKARLVDYGHLTDIPVDS